MDIQEYFKERIGSGGYGLYHSSYQNFMCQVIHVASFERNAYTQTQKLHDNLHSHKTERDNIIKEFFLKKTTF